MQKSKSGESTRKEKSAASAAASAAAAAVDADNKESCVICQMELEEDQEMR